MIAIWLLVVRKATWTPSTQAKASSTSDASSTHNSAVAFIDPVSSSWPRGGVARLLSTSVISDATYKQMIEALKTVVTRDGTAPDAAMKNYVLAGKTGTAQKAENGVYVSGKFVSSFIGFFPADHPAPIRRVRHRPQ